MPNLYSEAHPKRIKEFGGAFLWKSSWPPADQRARLSMSPIPIQTLQGELRVYGSWISMLVATLRWIKQAFSSLVFRSSRSILSTATQSRPLFPEAVEGFRRPVPCDRPKIIPERYDDLPVQFLNGVDALLARSPVNVSTFCGTGS